MALRLCAQRLQEIRHLDRDERRFRALVRAFIRPRALERLLERIHREHAERDRYAGLRADLRRTARAFARDIFEMRRVAANDGAERDQCVVFAAVRERLERDGDLERARHAHHLDVAPRGPVTRQRVQRAGEKLLAHQFVESGKHDSEADIASIESALHTADLRHRDAFLPLAPASGSSMYSTISSPKPDIPGAFMAWPSTRILPTRRSARI